MMNRGTNLFFILVLFPLVLGVSGEGVTEITAHKTTEQQIRFISGDTICAESLNSEGRWVSSYWSKDGQEVSPAKTAIDAFILEITREILHGSLPVTVSTGWQWVSGEKVKTEKGYTHHVIELSNPAYELKLKIHTLVDGTPVMKRWLDITNTSEKMMAITKLFPWSGQLWSKGKNFKWGRFTEGHWTREGWFEWELLEYGTVSGENRLGHGHDDPFFVVQNQDNGEHFICHLAWSANWYEELRTRGKGLEFKIGPSAVDTLRVLDPGETVTTPAVHLGYVKGDFDTTVQTMHTHIRESVIPPRKEGRKYLVEFHLPSDIGFYGRNPQDPNIYNAESVKKNMDLAASIGCEVFIIDAPAPCLWEIPGDWYPSPKRYPGGLEPLRQYALSKGMKYGFLIEQAGGRGNVGACKAAQNPGWMVGNRFDLTKPEVAEWYEKDIDRFVNEYKIDIYRFDDNSGSSYEGQILHKGPWKESQHWKYLDAFYAIYERVNKKYPDLILQQCAGGGGRNDLGTAGCFHETYLTDGTWLPRYLYAYSGSTTAFPPEHFVPSFGVLGGRGPLDMYLRCVFSLSTPLIYASSVLYGDLDEIKLSPEDLAKYQKYSKLYKEFIRPAWPTARMYHYAPVSPTGSIDEKTPWFAVGFATPDAKKGWATLVRADIKSGSDTFVLKPGGLNAGNMYKVTFDTTGETKIISGADLISKGLPIHLPLLHLSELVLFERQ